MKVAIVHDDLVQWGGAERVLEGICEIYPGAPIFTSVFDKENTELNKRFGSKKVYTSFLQKIPGWKKLYKALLPFYPIAFEQFNFDEFDLVISHTTRFAKSIITKPRTKHICYCHTPPRFLWRYSGEGNFGILETLMNKLRIYDQVASRRVDYFIAGSKNAQLRIKKVYRRESKVIYPFVDLERFKSVESFDGGYFLVISRLNKYKRVDLAVEACANLKFPLKVIGIGPELSKLQTSVDRHQSVDIQLLGNMDDETLVQVLAGCRALIIPGIEDFGLTSLEAQILGKPVIAYRNGGVMETVLEGETGLFFDEPKAVSLADILLYFNDSNHLIKSSNCINNAAKFSKENFKTNFKQTVDDLVYT